MSKILAACGNDCASCPRYVAHPYEKSEEELHHTAELWMKIGYRDHVVSSEKIECHGCKAGNWCRYGIVECTSKKGINNCGECSEYPCSKISECFEVTTTFEDSIKNVCSKEEGEMLLKAYFEKKKNLDAVHK